VSAAVIVIVVAVRGCTGSRVTTSLAGGAPVVATVELPTEMCGWYFIAQVHVNGAGPYDMMLDTGMQLTQITPDAAEGAGVRGAIRTLRIGDLEIEGRVPCRVRSLETLSQALGRPIDGIPAHDVFADVLLTYDFPGEAVRVSGGRIDSGGAGVVPTGGGPRPFVRAAVDGRTIPVLIYTGSSRGLTLQNIDAFELGSGPEPTGARVRLDGVHHVHSGRLADDVAFGPLTLIRPIVHESVSVNLIGQVYLRDFVLTFDQRADLCLIESPAGMLDAPLPSEPILGMGVAMKPCDRGLEVQSIFSGGPAEAAGVHVGDVVVAVNGVTVLDRGCVERTREPAVPSIVVLSIERGADSFDLDVERVVLVP
jgi:hypothetical protein